MHPTYSVIVFTTASGAGYGLLFWLSLAHLLGRLPGSGWLAFVAMVVAMGLVTVGLLASTLHLGRPERALGAFSQWRTSWLSREGVAAVLTYIPSGLLALFWLFQVETEWSGVLAGLSAIGAVATVYCTGMIYGSLRTIRQWHNRLTPIVYLTIAMMTGGILLGLLMTLLADAPSWVGYLILMTAGIAAVVKLSYWRQIDADAGRYTAEMALGLGKDGGQVRPLDPPHTRPNFVMREMGYQVARKHALFLRRLAILMLFAVPLTAAILVQFVTAGAGFIYLAATLAAAWGVLIERWLFFAEAEHVSQLFYGAHRA